MGRWLLESLLAGIAKAMGFCLGAFLVISSNPLAYAPKRRIEALRDAGIISAVAVPAVSEDETPAVLEFLAVEPVQRTDRFVRALYRIGHEIDYFFAPHRHELSTSILTPRELEVLALGARGQSAAFIAAQLHLSPATIKRHFERSYARLGVSDRSAAVAEAMRRGRKSPGGGSDQRRGDSTPALDRNGVTPSCRRPTGSTR